IADGPCGGARRQPHVCDRNIRLAGRPTARRTDRPCPRARGAAAYQKIQQALGAAIRFSSNVYCNVNAISAFDDRCGDLARPGPVDRVDRRRRSSPPRASPRRLLISNRQRGEVEALDRARSTSPDEWNGVVDG
ncbi:MAG TPA: hypothetical protein VKB80_11465, partial [Kofleriaceae bacterium]|nr:hypothetical protein [Kofleriaceae bacterium]